MWIWLALALPLLGWMLWYGDNGHWFHNHAWIFAGAISIVVSGIAVIRIHGTGATARYLRIHFWVPLLLLLSFGTALSYQNIQRIEGATAEAAAKKIFNRISLHIDEPVHLVEHVGKLPYDLDPKRCKTFWIIGANEPRGRFSVCRHKWYGWTFASSAIFPPSKTELDRAKDWLTESRNVSGAKLILQSVIANYPNTPAETEARELLTSIGEPAR